MCVCVCLSMCVRHQEARYSPTRSRSLILGNSPVIGCLLLQKKERHTVRTPKHTGRSSPIIWMSVILTPRLRTPFCVSVPQKRRKCHRAIREEREEERGRWREGEGETEERERAKRYVVQGKVCELLNSLFCHWHA